MSFKPPENVPETLKNLPAKPGVYIHKNNHGKVIYVGKAINLRSRVLSYFHTNVGFNKDPTAKKRNHRY